MEIVKSGMAGTMESGDIQIIIEPAVKEEIEIFLNSPVERQFGKQIRSVIAETLKEMGVKKAIIKANDKGALDCTIRARVQTAVCRAVDVPLYPWQEGIR